MVIVGVFEKRMRGKEMRLLFVFNRDRWRMDDMCVRLVDVMVCVMTPNAVPRRVREGRRMRAVRCWWSRSA